MSNGPLTDEDLLSMVEMEKTWKTAASAATPGECHEWSAVDRSIVSRRIQEVGRQDVAARLGRHCESWATRRTRGWIRSRQPGLVPPIALLKNSGVWNSLASDAAVANALRVSEGRYGRYSKAELLRIGEFDEVGAIGAPKSGW